MQDFKKLANYLNVLVSGSIYPTLKGFFSASTKEIVNAINALETQKKENPEVYKLGNPESITTPLLSQLQKLSDALKSLDREVVVKHDTEGILKALKAIETKIPELEKEEVIDYTLMMDEMCKIMEKPHYSLEFIRIQDILQKISERPSTIPQELITKDGIKVVGLHGKSLGRSVAYETIWQKNVAGTRINPATEDKQDPMAKYKYADVDDDGTPNYYGATDTSGNWFILQEVVSAGANTYRYAAGTTAYTTNWTNRAGLSYDYLYNVTIS